MSEQRKIIFYVNDNLKTERLSYIPLLFPFWGELFKAKNPYISSALKQYGFDKNYYDITSDIEIADFVLLPYDYWDLKNHEPELLNKFIKQAQDNNKLILIYAYGDISDEINVKNSYVLRTGQYNFQLQKNAIVIPAFTEDLLQSYGSSDLKIRNKSEKASVGFTGWANSSWLLFFKTLIKEFSTSVLSILNIKYKTLKKGLYFRKKAINKLQQSQLVSTNFNVRSSFSGHTYTIQGDVNEIRQDFVDNMLNSDYALCVKGDGNFSNRFYEALSLGRIPLFINTECVLPLENIINYNECCVFVDFKDVKNIDKILSEFHKKITNKEFIEMQKKARNVFVNYLRTDRFTKYLMQELLKISENNKVTY